MTPEELADIETEVEKIVYAIRDAREFGEEMIKRYEEALAHLENAKTRLMSVPAKNRRGESYLSSKRAIARVSFDFLQHNDAPMAEIRVAKVQVQSGIERLKRSLIGKLDMKNPKAEIAAYVVRQHIKKRGLKPLGYNGALVVHQLGYDEAPRKGETRNDSGPINRYYTRSNRVAKALREIRGTKS